jgi:hypothetical protein
MYAMEQGPTVRILMRAATFDRVATLLFLDCFVGGGSSLSTSTDDGDINMNLKAYNN